MARRSPGLIIAGTHSGCGKTQVSLALAAALAGRGVMVQGFKVGPDFIDPSHMSAVTGRPAHNLDGWMLSRFAVENLFQRHGSGADFCLVEGVMGLFDGASGGDETGSTAQMAKWLGLPVVLMVDARAQGRSVAALVQGFRDFDTGLRLAGVILTQVGGPGHVAVLQEALAAALPDLPCFGFLPRRPDLALPSRHLGLCLPGDVGWNAARLGAFSGWIEQGADVAGLMTLAGANPAPSGLPGTGIPGRGPGKTLVRLGVALDHAFCFYYRENLDLLIRAGVEPVFFSPLVDTSLPEGVQGLYFGGGYPELHARTLASNQAMRRAVLAAALEAMPIYAECGGLLYLLESLEDMHGRVWPMTGVFALRGRMHATLQSLGYRSVVFARDCLLGPAGTMVRGHEFHYAALAAGQDAHTAADPCGDEHAPYTVRDRRGRESRAGFLRRNTLGSFIHLHFGSAPQVAEHLARSCRNRAGAVASP